MENHHFYWVNQLFPWPFSIAICGLPEGIMFRGVSIAMFEGHRDRVISSCRVSAGFFSRQDDPEVSQKVASCRSFIQRRAGKQYRMD
jgi:hypothetical protein